MHPKNSQNAYQEKRTANVEPLEEEPNQTKSINLPYIHGVSEQLKRAQHQSNILHPHNP